MNKKMFAIYKIQNKKDLFFFENINQIMPIKYSY